MDYCTLFDSNYLDKGIVMINSIFAHSQNACMHVLCMDMRTHDILTNYYGTGKIDLITVDELIDYCPALQEIKEERSKGAFCWTCTPVLVEYIITKQNVEMCTYVDSDLKFYSDPIVLINEMLENNCVVQVIPHNFRKSIKGRVQEKNSGKNCVQFNTFMKEEKSLTLLNSWGKDCIRECSFETIGDQKYTNEWGKYEFVNSSSNLGAGVAPWNISCYRKSKSKLNSIVDRRTKKEWPLIFFHFANIAYIERDKICIHAKDQELFVDEKLIDTLYHDYIIDTERIKYEIKRDYGFEPVVTSYPIKEKKEIGRALKKYTMSEFVSVLYHNVIRKIKRSKTIIDISSILFEIEKSNGVVYCIDTK